MDYNREDDLRNEGVRFYRNPYDLQARLRLEMTYKIGIDIPSMRGFVHACAEAAEKVFYEIDQARRSASATDEILYIPRFKKRHVYWCPYCSYRKVGHTFRFCPQCGHALHWIDPQPSP